MTDEPVTESRVEAARRAVVGHFASADFLGATAEELAVLAEFEQAVSEKARDELLGCPPEWTLAGQLIFDAGQNGESVHDLIARLAASPTEEAVSG